MCKAVWHHRCLISGILFKLTIMSNDDILNKLLSHKLRFYEIDKIVGVSEAVALRRRAIEKLTGVRLQHVSRFSIDASSDRKFGQYNSNLSIQ